MNQKLSNTNTEKLISRGSSTAKQGFQNEGDVITKFNSWKSDRDAQEWLRLMEYKLDEIEKVEAIKVTGSHKTDVQVKITVSFKDAIIAENISVKLVSNKSGFNQIDKRWVDKYKDLWAIPEDITDIFKGRDKLAASWLLIYFKPKNIWSLLPMSLVMNFYGKGEIMITGRGNLRIGKITVQRKGGDSGKPTANMLQFKIDPSVIIKLE